MVNFSLCWTYPRSALTRLRGFFPHTAKTAMIACLIGVNLGAGVYTVYDGWRQWQAQQRMASETIGAVERVLERKLSLAISTLRLLKAPVEQAGQDVEAIRAILFSQLETGDGVLRYAWSDKQFRLRTGSHVGVLARMPDLSGRDYIQFARRYPGVLYLSRVTQNIITGKPHIILAIGLAERGVYQGTLTALINLQTLADILQQRVADGDAEVAVFTPYGESVFSTPLTPGLRRQIVRDSRYRDALKRASGKAFSEASDGFIVIGRASNRMMQSLAERAVEHWLWLTIVLSSAVWLLFQTFSRYLAAPMEKILSILHETPLPSSPTGGARDLARLASKAEAIRDLLQRVEYYRSEAKDAGMQLREAIALIHRLQEEEVRVLHSASAEMEETFRAISQYAFVLEEQILARQIDPAHAYEFDDVTEAAENLKFIANTFHLLCLERVGQLPRQGVADLTAIVVQTLDVLEPSLERRNLTLDYVPSRPHPVSLEGNVLRHLVWGILYLAVKHAADEETLHVALRALPGDGSELTVAVGHCHLPLLQLKERDLRPFFPLHEDELREAVRRRLSEHVNSQLVRLFLREGGGRYRVESYGAQGYCLVLAFPAPLRLAALIDDGA